MAYSDGNFGNSSSFPTVVSVGATWTDLSIGFSTILVLLNSTGTYGTTPAYNLSTESTNTPI